MAYCTLADIKDAASTDDLALLTDDIGAASIDPTIVAKATADADATIDAYLCARYELPLSETPYLVRKLSVDLTIYNLHSRRAMSVSSAVQARRDDAMEMLKALSSGKASLVAVAGAPSATVSAGIATNTRTQLFNSDVMDAFTVPGNYDSAGD